MRHLINTEFIYNKYLFIGAFCLVPVLGYHKVHPIAEDVPLGIFIFMIIVMTATNWNTFRNKENRDYQIARLPISHFHKALSRIGMVIIPGIIISMIYDMTLLLLGVRESQAFHSILIPWGLVIAIMSIYFILRDLFLHFLRNNRLFPMNKERTKTLLVSLLLAINLLGFYFFISSVTEKLDFIGIIFRFFGHHPLITTLAGNAIWMGCSLVIAGLSLLTYRIRRYYLE